MRIRSLPKLICAAIALMVLSLPAQAGYSRFDKSTFTVIIPCLENIPALPGGVISYFQMALVFDGAQFHVSEIFQLDEVGECFASYDEETGVLTDQLWHKDKIFDVALISDNGFSFELESLEFRETSRTSLWRVSDGLNEVIIGGTIHILNVEDFPLPDSFIDAFSQADILVTEISQSDLEDDSGDSDGDLLINPDGLLSEILLPSTLEIVDEFLAQFGLTLEPIDELLPFWAGRIFVQLKETVLGYGPGVDFFFMSLADLAEIPNEGLESEESQLNILNSTAEEVSPDELILDAIETAESTEYFDTLDFYIDAWREGNIEFFEFLNDLQKEQDEESYNLILRDRNLAWVPQIEDMLLTEEVELILVGVGHLAGDDNVLELLEELGYTVERY